MAADELGPGWTDRLEWRGDDPPRAARRPLKAKTLGQFTATMKRGNQRQQRAREIDRALDAAMPEVDE
jgi:hypothetical protein